MLFAPLTIWTCGWSWSLAFRGAEGTFGSAAGAVEQVRGSGPGQTRDPERSRDRAAEVVLMAGASWEALDGGMVEVLCILIDRRGNLKGMMAVAARADHSIVTFLSRGVTAAALSGCSFRNTISYN